MHGGHRPPHPRLPQFRSRSWTASPASSTRSLRRTRIRRCRASSGTRRIGSSSVFGTSTGSRAATPSRPCENSGRIDDLHPHRDVRVVARRRRGLAALRRPVLALQHGAEAGLERKDEDLLRRLGPASASAPGRHADHSPVGGSVAGPVETGRISRHYGSGLESTGWKARQNLRQKTAINKMPLCDPFPRSSRTSTTPAAGRGGAMRCPRYWPWPPPRRPIPCAEPVGHPQPAGPRQPGPTRRRLADVARGPWRRRQRTGHRRKDHPGRHRCRWQPDSCARHRRPRQQGFLGSKKVGLRPDAGDGVKRTNEIGAVIPLLETLPDVAGRTISCSPQETGGGPMMRREANGRDYLH